MLVAMESSRCCTEQRSYSARNATSHTDKSSPGDHQRRIVARICLTCRAGHSPRVPPKRPLALRLICMLLMSPCILLLSLTYDALSCFQSHHILVTYLTSKQLYHEPKALLYARSDDCNLLGKKTPSYHGGRRALTPLRWRYVTPLTLQFRYVLYHTCCSPQGFRVIVALGALYT